MIWVCLLRISRSSLSDFPSLADEIVCTVEKKFFTLRPTYVIVDKQQEMTINVRKNLNLLHPEFTITSELDEIKFHTVGDFFASTFSITSSDEKETIATINRTSGYNIEILDEQYNPLVLIAVVMIIHLCCHHTKDE